MRARTIPRHISSLSLWTYALRIPKKRGAARWLESVNLSLRPYSCGWYRRIWTSARRICRHRIRDARSTHASSHLLRKLFASRRKPLPIPRNNKCFPLCSRDQRKEGEWENFIQLFLNKYMNFYHHFRYRNTPQKKFNYRPLYLHFSR